MAQFKVPQNVEAEDKIIGPLTLRQFIYVIIALMWGFVMWRIFISTPIIMIVAILPVSGVFLALGLIQREEQSFENYFIAIIRFLVVPRKRIWHKEEFSKAELITNEPAKKPELVLHSRNPEQVRGQLEKLALIVDTRGRVPKAASIQLQDEDNDAAAMSARVNVGTAGHEAPTQHVTDEDDILDMKNNTAAVAVGEMLKKAEVETHDKVAAQVAQGDFKPTPAPAQAQPLSPSNHSDDILNVAANSGGLSVAQVAAAANRVAAEPNRLVENQPVKLR